MVSRDTCINALLRKDQNRDKPDVVISKSGAVFEPLVPLLLVTIYYLLLLRSSIQTGGANHVQQPSRRNNVLFLLSLSSHVSCNIVSFQLLEYVSEYRGLYLKERVWILTSPTCIEEMNHDGSASGH